MICYNYLITKISSTSFNSYSNGVMFAIIHRSIYIKHHENNKVHFFLSSNYTIEFIDFRTIQWPIFNYINVNQASVD